MRHANIEDQNLKRREAMFVYLLCTCRISRCVCVCHCVTLTVVELVSFLNFGLEQHSLSGLHAAGLLILSGRCVPPL